MKQLTKASILVAIAIMVGVGAVYAFDVTNTQMLIPGTYSIQGKLGVSTEYPQKHIHIKTGSVDGAAVRLVRFDDRTVGHGAGVRRDNPASPDSRLWHVGQWRQGD